MSLILIIILILLLVGESMRHMTGKVIPVDNGAYPR